MSSKKVCESCGSDELHVEAYVLLNTGTLADSSELLHKNTTAWCENCKEVMPVVAEEEYVEKEN